MFTMQVVPPKKAPKRASSKAVIAWNVSDETVEKLYKPSTAVPYVLLVVTKDGKEVMRYIEELSEGHTTVLLENAGRYTIYGVIITSKGHYDGDEEFESICTWLKGHDGNRYRKPLLKDYSLVLYENKWYDRFLMPPFNVVQEEYKLLDVEILQDYFAQKPAKWIWNYVNAGYDIPARDQCEFRRRALWAFSLRIIFLIIMYIFFFMVAVIALLLNPKALQWRGFLHPFKVGLGSLIREGSEYDFMRRKDGRKRSLWFNLLRPIFPLTYVSISLYAVWRNAWLGLGYVNVGVLFVLGVILFIEFLSKLFEKCLSRISKPKLKRISTADAYREVRDAVFSGEYKPSILPVKIRREVQIASACRMFRPE